LKNDPVGANETFGLAADNDLDGLYVAATGTVLPITRCRDGRPRDVPQIAGPQGQGRPVLQQRPAPRINPKEETSRALTWFAAGQLMRGARSHGPPLSVRGIAVSVGPSERERAYFWR